MCKGVKSFNESNLDPQNINVIYDFIISDNNINCIIDTGAIFRLKSNFEYTQDILDYLKNNNKNKYDYILYFNENNELVKCDINKNISKFDNKFEMGVKSNDKFLMFFDNKHTRGTDIQLPSNTHALVTISHINDSVNIIQGIYRLRQLGYGQSCEFIIIKNGLLKIVKIVNGNVKILL